MERSSSSWCMAWSGRLRMTASSARTHMGSRALSCTTGSLQQHSSLLLTLQGQARQRVCG